MSSSSPRLIAIIGGTGAQGVPIARDLVRSGEYTARVLTRDASSARFRELQSYGAAVEGVVGSFASEESLRETFRGAWGAFVNIDGFNSGEKAEVYWTIRELTEIQAWEIALEEGVQFYVHGNLDYGYKKSGFRPEFRCGHYDAKGRVGEYILSQNRDAGVRSRMRSAVFTTGPYVEMTIGRGTIFQPAIEEEGNVAIWRAPLCTVPFTALDDCGVFVKWLFDNNAGEADGMELQSALAHVTFAEYVDAFTKVTGKPAKWIDVPIAEHLTNLWGDKGDTPCGYNADPQDPASMSLRDNFTGFFNLWRHSGGNKGIITRDYELLDRIYPGRIRSVEEWMRREHDKGLKLGLGSLWDRIQPENLGHVLKLTEDRRQGRL
ncbi:NAD(P)-binding protein [Xylariaceae sp. FL0594]|nr:NAD(P)-binding protein [Xylariaceae sp. FL0594]